MTVTTNLETNRRTILTTTAGYYVAFIALGLTSASLGPTLPGLAEHTKTLLSQISFLFMARSLGYLIGSQGGRLYDRLPGHLVMAVALLVMAITMALAPLISMLSVLTVVLLLIGVAEGTVDVGGNTLLVWIHRHNVGPYMNALHFFFGVGAFLSPIIVAQALLLTDDISWAYWVLALLMAPISVWLWHIPSPVIQKAASRGSVGQINYVLVSLVALFLFLYVGAEVSFGGWIFTYTLSLELTGQANAAYLTSAFWGALTVGRLLGIPIAARFRPRVILLTDLAGCLLSVALILFWSDSLAAIWLGTMGMGLFMASIFPVTLSLAERRMTITGKITGWFFVGASLGGMTVPWLIGQLFESSGATIVMLIVAVDLLLAVGVLVALLLYSHRLVAD